MRGQPTAKGRARLVQRLGKVLCAGAAARGVPRGQRGGLIPPVLGVHIGEARAVHVGEPAEGLRGGQGGGEQVPEDLEVRAVNERVREDLGLPGIKRARDPKGW